MRSIEALLPSGGRDDTAGLLALDADDLARYVADPTRPWWRRRPCAVALAGRVPERHLADLVARVHDPDEVTEVRVALLDALGDRPELLPWLRHEDRRTEGRHGMAEAVLKARGVMGDRSAAPELATLAASPWSRTRKFGEAGLDALVARYGTDAVLADLGDQRPQDRVFRLRARHRAGEDVVDALADPDPEVAHLAQSLISDPHRLRDYLGTAPTADARLWAAYALHRLTGDTAETRAIHDAMGRPRVAVPGLDDELRRAVLHEYARRCERGSDPRWGVEALCAGPLSCPDQDDQLRRVAAALTAAGHVPEPAVSCGEWHRQGGGTYHVVPFGEHRVTVSQLGRFVAGDDGDATVRRALGAAGFRWIDDATGAIRVTGLPVYYFGAREPLSVQQLLFYWQD
jgi:hypothetical protein